MVPEQAFQVQKDNEARLERTGRRTPSSSLCIWTTMFTRNAPPVGCFHVNQRCPHPLWRIYELFWTLVPWSSSSRPNGQNSDDVMAVQIPSTDSHQHSLALFTHSQTFFNFLPSIFIKEIYIADFFFFFFACRFLWWIFKRLNKQPYLNLDFVNSCKF